MKRLLVTILAMVALAAIVTPAVAARGGKGKPGADAAATSDISLNEQDPRLGSTVTFTATTQDLAGWESPMVQIDCHQADTLVWSALGMLGTSFKLGGDVSDWTRAGGSAECTAMLLAIGSRHGTQTVRLLDDTSFTAAG